MDMLMERWKKCSFKGKDVIDFIYERSRERVERERTAAKNYQKEKWKELIGIGKKKKKINK